MKLQEIMNLDKNNYMNTFGSRVPVCFEYGKGINLWDTEGRKYYDFIAGIAVNALGHAHPKLVDAISKQAERLIHCSNYYYIENQSKLAKLLVDSSCADKVFFSNSGAEANEGVIKLARIYFNKKGMSDRYEIISLVNSFHGRTLATLAATGQEKYRKPFYPLTPGFKNVPINDMEALENAISKSTCAIMLEPIQGEGGVYPVDEPYMKAIKKLCEQNGLLLIFDEIQTGMGRTGKMFGYEHYGVEPDIFTLAKALGGGVPIGAICAKEFVAQAFEPGDHGTTFGGNPLACAAGLAVLEAIKEENLVENAEKMGNYFSKRLHDLKLKYNLIAEIRGKGLMIGIELCTDKAKDIKERCFEKGYLIGNVSPYILRLLPPLIVTRHEIDQLIDTLDTVLAEFV